MNELVADCSRCGIPAEMPLVWVPGNDVSQRIILCDWCAWLQYLQTELFFTEWGKCEPAYRLDGE